MRELPETRQDINRVDSAIRELFLLRMSLALEVGKTKARSDDKIYKPDREGRDRRKRPPVWREEQLKYVSLLQSMIRASREYQYSEILRQTPEKFPFYPAETLQSRKPWFYQGVPGAYQELAARACSRAQREPQNVPTWRTGFPVQSATARPISALCRSRTQPQARSAKSMTSCSTTDLYINRSYIKNSHYLAALPGTKLEDVKRVCSHPHALPQCHSFISEHDLEAIEVANTAIAAQNAEKGRQEPCCHLLAGGGCALRSRYSRRGHQRHAAQRNTLLSPSAKR